MAHPSISVVMPALNEERNLAGSVAAVAEAFEGFCDYEVIIFDDGSTDRTGEIAHALEARDPRVRVVHHATSCGIGHCYRQGAELARHDYYLMVPGDDETPASTIRAIAERAGEADIVVTYTVNRHVRPLHRRIVSRLFTVAMNTVFGLRLRYYNGNCLIRTSLLRTLPKDTSGFAYMAMTLIRLLNQGHSYVEAGIMLQRRGSGRSKCLQPRSVINVLQSVFALAWETRTRPSRG